jgi:hypothetical protein
MSAPSDEESDIDSAEPATATAEFEASTKTRTHPDANVEPLRACAEHRCPLVARPTLADVCPSCGAATKLLSW